MEKPKLITLEELARALAESMSCAGPPHADLGGLGTEELRRIERLVKDRMFVHQQVKEAKAELDRFFAERDKGQESRFTREEVDRKAGNALRILDWVLLHSALTPDGVFRG